MLRAPVSILVHRRRPEASGAAPADQYSQGTGVFSPAHKSYGSASAGRHASATAPQPQQAAPSMYQQRAVPQSVPVRPAVQYTSTPVTAAPPPQQVAHL